MQNIRIFRAGLSSGYLKRAEAFLSSGPFSSLPEDGGSYTLFPGFCDVHVHFREPGFSYKETIASGCRAAAHGGYTAVCAMPNLSPVPDSREALEAQLELIRRDAVIRVIPYGAITRGERGGELADLDGMAADVCGFSDDGHGVQREEMMRLAMEKAKSLGRIIAAHCEDNALLVPGGCVHDGLYARQRGLAGISSESEWRQIERDVNLAAETGCAYHVCHISCSQSVRIIREAKQSGVDVTCETAPHYLLLDEGSLRDEGRFKMNPPVRGRADREALLEGLTDGTIDMIATDHAPHSTEEKSKGPAGSAFGIVGIETAFPLLYSRLVKPGMITLEKLVDLIALAPRRRFSIPLGDEFTLWSLNRQSAVDSSRFLSKGKATPFEGWAVSAECVATYCNQKFAYIRES